MRELLLALVLVSAGLAGCIGSDDAPTKTASGDAEASQNPWQAGLADEYPTPDVAEHRSREERRANLAEPGDPQFVQFDAAFEAFMESHDIPTGQVAVMHEGELRYTRGYGYADKAGDEPANASTMFRVMSITKPMTAAVVSIQVEQGRYNFTDPVFCVPPDPAPNCLLDIEPHPEFPVVDEDLGEVQVRHLLNHTGGWGPTINSIFLAPASFYDTDTIEIAQEMGIESPPPAWRLAQYVMGQEIENEPGEEYEYCNVCYMLAGLIAEAETGASMQALYEAYIWEPLEISEDIEVGRTLPSERNPREPFYACEPLSPEAEEDAMAQSVFAPNETVCWPEGGWSMETIRSFAGVVASASAIAAVYEVYAHHGFTYTNEEGRAVPVPGPVTWQGHTGSAPGTATMTGVVEDEGTATGKVQYVALFNKIGIDEPYYSASDSYRFEEPLLALAAGWGATENVQEVAG